MPRWLSGKWLLVALAVPTVASAQALGPIKVTRAPCGPTSNAVPLRKAPTTVTPGKIGIGGPSIDTYDMTLLTTCTASAFNIGGLASTITPSIFTGTAVLYPTLDSTFNTNSGVYWGGDSSGNYGRGVYDWSLNTNVSSVGRSMLPVAIDTYKRLYYVTTDGKDVQYSSLPSWLGVVTTYPAASLLLPGDEIVGVAADYGNPTFVIKRAATGKEDIYYFATATTPVLVAGGLLDTRIAVISHISTGSANPVIVWSERSSGKYRLYFKDFLTGTSGELFATATGEQLLVPRAVPGGMVFARRMPGSTTDELLFYDWDGNYSKKISDTCELTAKAVAADYAWHDVSFDYGTAAYHLASYVEDTGSGANLIAQCW